MIVVILLLPTLLLLFDKVVMKTTKNMKEDIFWFNVNVSLPLIFKISFNSVSSSILSSSSTSKWLVF